MMSLLSKGSQIVFHQTPLVVLGLFLSTSSWAQIFFEADFEGADGTGEIPFVGSANVHAGGGYITFLGGEVNNGINPGDGTQDYTKFTNVILDNSSDARLSVDGSNFALKTQYRGGIDPLTKAPYQASFQKNTTIINFPETDIVYVRWYQKWGRDWVWPSDQQKLIKLKGFDQSQNFKVGGNHDYIYLTKRTPIISSNLYGNLNETSVYSKLPQYTTATDYRQEDSIPDNENFSLETNRWYCIEVMVKSNTPDPTGVLVDGIQDAEFRYWINNELKFEYTGTHNRGNKTGGISTIELQHVLQRGSAPENQVNHDTPTWMDNIVVADQPIGCPELPVASPAAPMPTL